MSNKEISFEEFLKVDIRVGKILKVQLNEKAKKPAYILDIDFGENIGIKKSSAQITENYQAEELLNKQICAVVNFPIKRVAGIKSEALVLAIVCKNTGAVLIEPTKPVMNGERLA